MTPRLPACLLVPSTTLLLWLAAATSGAQTVTCTATPSTVAAGQKATITAHASGLQPPLRFHYTTSDGSISGDTDTATLLTGGLKPQLVHVNCFVTDAAGRTAASAVILTVTPSAATQPSQYIPPPPPEPKPPAHFHAASHEHNTSEAAIIGSHAATGSSATTPAPGLPSAAAASTGNTGQPDTTGAGSDPYALGDQVEAWKNQLKSGNIDWTVPATMTAHQSSPVSVTIHGFADATAAPPGAVNGSPLKVSPNMNVVLVANPGEFTITPVGKTGVQFVPNDGVATWNWSVTPVNPSASQTLNISVYLEYPNGPEDDVYDKSYPVTVKVQSFFATVVDDYASDPNAWFKYLLPGGAGFATLAGIVTWWMKRRRKPDDDDGPAPKPAAKT